MAATIAAARGAEVPLPVAALNDNTRPAGQLSYGILTVRLELRAARWYPDSRTADFIRVYCFAEEGREPQDPGPLLRVEEGTEIQASLHNFLPVTATIHGLHSRPGNIDDAITLAPGERREVKFAAGAPGTYFYWASTRKLDFPPPIRVDEDTELAGALIVDRRGAARDDRVFVINLWATRFMEPQFREQLAINGRSWPDSEHLTLALGKPVHWRIINPTASDHAMHLHGFFYLVTGAGDSEHFERYASGQERRVVTEHVDTGRTYEMTWVPERPGNWLFHCHMTGHMTTETAPELFGPSGAGVPPPHAHDEAASGMYGLVLGITVLPGDAPVRPATPESAVAPHPLRLYVRERPAGRYMPAGPGFFLEGTSKQVQNFGPPIVLTRGEPTVITVTNQTSEPTAVHWHGIELESFYDGVPEWAGTGNHLAPPVPPGGSFEAHMTPPRAGTYIYHTHWHDVAQLASGLYGPLIVLDQGEKFDPETDKSFLIGRAGPNVFHDPLLLNGSAQPNELGLVAGVRYRFRFINITPNDSILIISITRDGKLAQWRAIGKDGAALPASQALAKDASQLITVGETYDFEFTPEATAVYELSVAMPAVGTPVQKLTQVVMVSAPKQ
jgi:FtsP/CotA-like multicopper oxidase with cupredoxin domain